MNPSADFLRQEAGRTGFWPEILEKVVRLLELLEALQRHPYLKSRWVLKGGTALNLFVFDVPRLSVDIDINYTGALDRTTMLAERQAFEQAVQAVASRLGLRLARTPAAHAGGKWRLRYDSALGQGGTLEVDVNYMYRLPLWPPVALDSKSVGPAQVRAIPVLDSHELAGGKLAALFSRQAGRDLFDVHHLLTRTTLDRDRLRLAFVLYGAMNRRDWRTVSADDVGAVPADVRQQLLPVLPATAPETRSSSMQDWAGCMVRECREAMSLVLPFSRAEREFLDRLLDDGEILPELLGVDEALVQRIQNHPALQCKARNVRSARGGKK